MFRRVGTSVGAPEIMGHERYRKRRAATSDPDSREILDKMRALRGGPA